MEAIKLPFSNIQTELLKLYSHQISDYDLIQIKEMIGQYFAKRLSGLADETWEKNGWTNDEMDNILNEPNQ